MPASKRPPDGHVSMTRIAHRLHVDRRVLKRLYERGEIAGMRQGGVVWLERRSLAGYLWSRPRCVREDCDRRVIGDGPGCAEHWRNGRRRVSHHCEQCGRETRGHGRLCRACATSQQNARRGAEGVKRLQKGRKAYRKEVKRVKKKRKLLNISEVVKRLLRAAFQR
jgi:hypothetical protein